MLVGITGYSTSGKDTIADWLNWDKLSFAKPLKNAASILLNRPMSEMEGHNYDRKEIMPEWGFSVRWFLQTLGTEGMRGLIRDDFWIKHMGIRISQCENNVVISDVRFPNEADFVREQGGVIWKVVKPGLISGNHKSETSIDLINPDVTILNDGTKEDLYYKIEDLF